MSLKQLRPTGLFFFDQINLFRFSFASEVCLCSRFHSAVLITGLQQPQIASAAATALQSICAQCQAQMVANFSGLLQVAHAVDSFNLSNDAVIGVLKGQFFVVSKVV